MQGVREKTKKDVPVTEWHSFWNGSDGQSCQGVTEGRGDCCQICGVSNDQMFFYMDREFAITWECLDCNARLGNLFEKLFKNKDKA